MTKLVVVSDSHNAPENLRQIFEAESPMDAVIYLGDGLRDLDKVKPDFRGVKFYTVRGNCDADYPYPEPREALLPLDGVLFFYTHGNYYGVKSGYSILAETAASRGADVALFGHTHNQVQRRQDGVLLVNPGSCGVQFRDYAVFRLEKGEILQTELKKLPAPRFPVQRLNEVDSTNTYIKTHLDEVPDLGVVFTDNQTKGRGRLGRAWENAAGQGLYYSILLRRPLAQPATLPLLASLAVRDALQQRFGVDCVIKWPNDLLLNGKKLVGILCESVPLSEDGARGYICGIGVNLCQTQSYFTRAQLPYATSLALQGVTVQQPNDAIRLQVDITNRFKAMAEQFAKEGFAPFRAEYSSHCVNLGRTVTFEGGSGTAAAVDEEGGLVVQTADGSSRVFTGEVSVGGIYGSV